MQIKELTMRESAETMKTWKESGFVLPKVDGIYSVIRKDLQSYYADNIRNVDCDDYEKDVRFAVYIYEYFKQYEKDGFNMRAFESDGFWRYLSLVVVPDVVGTRWGKDNDNHYYKRGYLIWLKMLWWYIYLSWYRTLNETESLLLSRNFNTDTLLQLVERSGKFGTYVSVYRLIMYYYHKLPAEKLKRSSGKEISLFRVIMKLNTAKLVSVDPVLYLGGVDGYVKSLFYETGIEIS